MSCDDEVDETELAKFYNFKDESTCKLCDFVKEALDRGGKKLVCDRLGILETEQHEHNFKMCYLHYYWLCEVYNKEDYEQRPMNIVIDEAEESFNELKSFL